MKQKRAKEGKNPSNPRPSFLKPKVRIYSLQALQCTSTKGLQQCVLQP